MLSLVDILVVELWFVNLIKQKLWTFDALKWSLEFGRSRVVGLELGCLDIIALSQ